MVQITTLAAPSPVLVESKDRNAFGTHFIAIAWVSKICVQTAYMLSSLQIAVYQTPIQSTLAEQFQIFVIGN